MIERKQNAFTLVEMLVVIAIISILASLLMPALGKAVESGRLMVCANNQRQLGVLFQMYSEDFRYWVPGNYMSANIISGRYIKATTFFSLVCPSSADDTYRWFSQRLSYVIAKKDGRVTASGDNADTPNRMCLISEIRHPSRTGTLTDGTNGWVFNDTTWDRIVMRHDSRLNILYVNGHIQAHNPGTLTWEIFLVK